jgi:uncharacterized protein (DUF1800 family)
MRRAPRAPVAVLAVFAVVLSAAATQCQLASPDPALEVHALSRAGYGPDAWSLQRIRQLGIRGYLEEQLRPETIDDGAFEARLRAAYPSVQKTYRQLQQAYGDPMGPLMMTRGIVDDLAAAKLMRAVESRRQLEALLTDFFFDHFNVYAPEGVSRLAVAPFEAGIRRHVLGSFEEMLIAIARSPAMLYYLDNFRSTMERGSMGGMNENYARELMELHTIGAEGGYTHDDIVEVARAFTGWTIDTQLRTEDGFWFDAALHDPGEKSVMGFGLPANGGQQDGITVLRLLARHPATAKRLSRLLVQRFVNEVPPQALVDSAARTWLRTGGDLREVMRTILLSAEFLSPWNVRAKMKRPLVFTAGWMRLLGAPFERASRFAMADLKQLGEVPYEARLPIGYPDESAYWASSGTLLARFNAMEHLARRYADYGFDWQVRGGTSAQIVDALARRLFPGGGLSDASRLTAIAYVDSLAGLTDWERVWSAASMLLSAPEFARH